MKHNACKCARTNKNKVKHSTERTAEKDIMGLMVLAFFHAITYISLYSKKITGRMENKAQRTALGKETEVGKVKT